MIINVGRGRDRHSRVRDSHSHVWDSHSREKVVGLSRKPYGFSKSGTTFW